MNYLSELEIIFQKTFHNKDLFIQPQMKASDINGWDSLTHMSLINDIEQHFSIEFSFDEVSNFECIGDIIKCIETKKSA